MARRLEGLTAIVTGAGRGIGRGVAHTFALEGAKVIVADVASADEVADEITQLGGEALADSLDVTDFAGAEALVAKAINAWGKLDILVNVAGNIRLATIYDIAERDWDDVVRVHLRGTFNTSHFAAKHWVQRREYGRLINFTSEVGLNKGHPSLLSYAAAKAGIIGLTRSAANSLVSYNATANSVAPRGATRMGDSIHTQNQIANTPSESFVGTIRDPLNVAPLVVALASPAADHVTGRVFGAWGGHYSLFAEPHEIALVERDFLKEPDAVYADIERTLFAGLSLSDLPYPIPPLEDDWRTTYGVFVPRLDGARAQASWGPSNPNVSGPVEVETSDAS